MRILMMGTGGFAVPTFRGLLASSHKIPALITRPVPQPNGHRPVAVAVNPMRELAEQYGLPVQAPDQIRSQEALAMLASYRAELYVVCDFGQILPAEALAIARLGGINLHGSLLPKYRGAAPINWAIYDGQTQTGVTVIHMTPRLDAGPCLAQLATEIGPSEDAVELEKRLAEMGWHAVREAIGVLEQWDGTAPLGTAQDNSQATRAPRLKKSDGVVDWRRGAVEIFNQVRALKPWPGTFTYWHRPKGALRLLLVDVEVETPSGLAGTPGMVLDAEGDRLVVACGQGSLRLLQLQPAGKNRMTVQEFLRGYPLRRTDQLRPAES
jgi:methionyl-tRNA formyltransferase